MTTNRVQIRRQLEEALTPLDGADIREILGHLRPGGDDGAALEVLGRVHLPKPFALSDPEWREGLLDVLEERLSPEDEEDQDHVPTAILPDYASIAKDLRVLDEEG